MDMTTLGAAIAIMKNIPDTVVNRAQSAAIRAQIAAEEAKERNYSVKIQNNGLFFKSEVIN